MSRRLLIFLLLVIGLLFIIFIVMGSQRDEQRRFQLDLEVPTARQLRSRFTRKYQPEEIRVSRGGDEGCAKNGRQLVIPQEVTCEFTMAADADDTKQLALTLQPGAASIFVELAQEDALTVEETLQPGEMSDNLDVYRRPDEREATLTLSLCVVPPPEEEDEEDSTPPEPEPCRVELTD